MNKIAIITSTRAEYGLLEPVIKELRNFEDESLRVELIVTGTHLHESYGMTINEIMDSGVRIDKTVTIPIASESSIDISSNQAKTLVTFTKLFEEESYDAVVLLGDRYETLAIAIAAGNTRTPIFHMCGGDTTEGAIDEWIRHSITKMSYLHFVTNEDSYRRVVQLGEEPDRVFNYGSTSIDNTIKVATMDKVTALDSIGMRDCDYALCTYHPVTMESGSVDNMMTSFLEATKEFPNIEFIVTKSNIDQGGARINEILDEAECEIGNLHVYSSLGIRRYLSLMKYALFVLGNSSSGIMEAPALYVSTVNIGDRQKGRLQSKSIVNCEADTASIVNAINVALSKEHIRKCKDVVSVYGDGNAGEKIAREIVEVVREGNIDLKKRFYDGTN